MPPRSSYTLALEIVPTAPLTHGAGNDGNKQRIRTKEHRVALRTADGDWALDEHGEPVWETHEIPHVSGAAFRATLREHALWHMLEVLDLRDVTWSMDALRLLLKGGQATASGSGLAIDRQRELRALFPLLDLWGWMDDSSATGKLCVSDVTPYVRELVDAGHLPTMLRPLQVDRGFGVPPVDEIAACSLPPIPLARVLTDRQYYAHDLRGGAAGRLLDAADTKALEDQRAAAKGQQLPAEQRRVANESMPHAFEAIAPGVPMVAELRLSDASEVEWDCLRWAIFRWISTGGYLGGAKAKGHGACRVQIRGALEYSPGRASVAQAGAVAVQTTAGAAYIEHLQAHREQIIAHVQAAKPGEKPAKKSKKAATLLEESE